MTTTRYKFTPRVPSEAKKALDNAFNAFERSPSGSTYSLWQDAVRTYEDSLGRLVHL